MDALALLLSRESALKLGAPAPDEDALKLMLRSAVRAPDHGRLRPWRFVVVPEHRREAFGDLLAQSMQRREPSASAEVLQRERDKAMRAPLIVVVAAHVNTERKIPAVEQLSAVAAAAQNIMLAAHALGYAAMWNTGAPAYDPLTTEALGLAPDDAIIGFLYIGTRLDNGATAPGADPRDYVSVWERWRRCVAAPQQTVRGSARCGVHGATWATWAMTKWRPSEPAPRSTDFVTPMPPCAKPRISSPLGLIPLNAIHSVARE